VSTLGNELSFPSGPTRELKLGLVAAVGLAAFLIAVANAMPQVATVEPVPVPADNGTPACGDARAYLQQVNAELAAFPKRVAAAQVSERKAEAVLAAATKQLQAKPDDAVLRLHVRTAQRNVSDAREELARVRQNGAKLEGIARRLGATASAECASAEPAPSETTAALAVPADNGTSDCAGTRNQMISLLRFRDRLWANEAFKAAGPLGLSDVARRQIETQIKRLVAQLTALAPKAAEACAKLDFSGTWTGTYHAAPDSCAPSGTSGPMTLTLSQTGSSLSGRSTDQNYELGCSTVDLHGAITGTVAGNKASIQSAYDNDGGTYAGTLTLRGNTLTFEEESGDTATLTRG
jgi:hypothetical protein